jgi:hypothetical protein
MIILFSGGKQMIRVVGRIKVTPRKMTQALEWAGKALAYEKKTGFSPATLLRPLTGDTTAIVFENQFSSMADFEAMLRKRQEDPQWIAILQETKESDWWAGATREIYDVVEVAE